MYNLKEITKKDDWNNFIINNFDFYSFLNSWEWGEFNILEWNEIFRYWIFNSDIQYWVLFLIKIKAKRWTYFLSPHSPLIKENYFQILKDIIPEIKKLAQKEKVNFLRLNWVNLNNFKNLKNYKKLGFIFAPIHAHAEETHLLDLNKDENILKNNLRKTTRYIINRAEKEGVEIIKNNNEENIFEFIKMHLKHANRTNWKNTYHAFSEKYIKNLFKVFWEKDINCIKAIYKNTTEASLVTIKFWKKCVYYLGASDIKNPKFSPAYLLQWRAILEAKNSWCDLYNFWWVAPLESKNHPLKWVSLFKRWFWWEDYYLIHAQDYPFNYKYYITYIIEKLRSIKRWYKYKKPIN